MAEEERKFDNRESKARPAGRPRQNGEHKNQNSPRRKSKRSTQNKDKVQGASGQQAKARPPKQKRDVSTRSVQPQSKVSSGTQGQDKQKKSSNNNKHNNGQRAKNRKPTNKQDQGQKRTRSDERRTPPPKRAQQKFKGARSATADLKVNKEALEKVQTAEDIRQEIQALEKEIALEIADISNVSLQF